MTSSGMVVYLDSGSQQTFTCNVPGTAAAVWNFTRLGETMSTQSTGLSAANNNPMITTTDTTDATPSSTITITVFATTDSGLTIHCINLEDGSVLGTAIISIGMSTYILLQGCVISCVVEYS